MKSKKFSTKWKSSKKPRKQRNYRTNAPLHIKQKFTRSHLSADLRKKYGVRSVGIRKGDKVKIMRGNFKKREGKVERVELKSTKVFVAGVEMAKKDGGKKMLSVHPSNIMIIELNLDDKLRQKDLEKSLEKK